MKKLLSILFLLPAITSASAQVATSSLQGRAGEGSSDWRLVWQDTFDGDRLDTDHVWNIEVNGDGGGNEELQYYRSENVSLGTEPETGARCLILTARREAYGGKRFTSGRVNTKENVFMTHGRIEARIRLPHTANGLWPAFWLLGNDYDQVGWPRCGEIDILEMGHADGIRGGTQTTLFNGACHWGYYNDQWQYPNYARASQAPYSLQDGFHLYTLEWDTERIRMYLDLDQYPDRAPYYEMGITDTRDDWSTGNWFHHDFFILFNLAVGGHFTGILNTSGITALPTAGSEARMYVDYVRVYQPDAPDYYFYGQWPTAVDAPAAAPATMGSAADRLVYDTAGRLVLRFSATHPQALRLLRPGTYVIRPADAAHHASACKIIVPNSL